MGIRLAGVTVAATLLIALSGCSGAGPSADSLGADNASGAADSEQVSGTLTVFAAASLKTTFDQLRETYMEKHPRVNFPEITYDGSSTLVTQIQEGAPADVFASADQANMDKAAELISERVDFVANTLQIAVAPGNPLNIGELADLANEGVLTVLCAPEVPCGNASAAVLRTAGVQVVPASEEQNVTSVLTKVASGEADAGLVYATDVKASAGRVQGLVFPEASSAVNVYPIAKLSNSANGEAARAFIDLVTGPVGWNTFEAAGFERPGEAK